MVLPRTFPQGAPIRLPCGLDRHAGPFLPVEELRGTLGTDWFRCGACRALLTRANADPTRVAA